MKALILNSGMGKRMGELTSEHPKCMTEISDTETILSRQLTFLQRAGVRDVVITTGLFDRILVDYCDSLHLDLNLTFVNNPIYDQTNYIYSIYMARDHLDDDVLLMHGDLVFEYGVLESMLQSDVSQMTISTTLELPDKDFKAVTSRHGDSCRIEKVGIQFFDEAVSAQPMYRLLKKDWMVWLNRIIAFCEEGNSTCYAEDALNEVTDACLLVGMDVKDALCNEIDTAGDLAVIRERIRKLEMKTVYMCFSTDIIHGGHIDIIDKASKLGRLTVGILSDEAVTSYKRYPLLSYKERVNVMRHIDGVADVIEQKSLSYAENCRRIQPDYVVHGDDWKTGFQSPIRNEVIAVLEEYGGRLVEYPYSDKAAYQRLERNARSQLSIPDVRRGRLRKLIEMKGVVTAIEAHSGITGLIAEKTTVLQDGKTFQFDAMWVSSLCDSTAKGKPDIELVDMSSRLRTIDDIMEVTTKPIILDGDTGGLTEHFVYTVKTLERMGVSAIIIEDKTGLKKNSLFGTEVEQTQDSIENFCEKIAAGKKALKTKQFMIIARIESLILERGMEDALRRAFAFVGAGADGIMIHSRKKNPSEIFTFLQSFRGKDATTPIVVVPTSFNEVTEEEFKTRGVNVVIYANHLTRSGFPAMQRTAETILRTHRAKEADDLCMSIKDILTLIPEED